jgi:hypothetical protein
MVVGDKKFGVVSYVLVGSLGVFSPRKFFCNFSTSRTEMLAFSETDFWITALHCALIDRI